VNPSVTRPPVKPSFSVCVPRGMEGPHIQSVETSLWIPAVPVLSVRAQSGFPSTPRPCLHDSHTALRWTFPATLLPDKR
jgi:hypothetical protein